MTVWTFGAEIVEWRGPAPFLFAPLPEDLSAEVKEAARGIQYWGQVPVVARIGGTEFATAMWPRHGRFLLPVKVAVQRAENIALGDEVVASIRLAR
ncbi:DUF1905 domain-containing protein [Litorihabitans aurantiacus]|uniref:DUF1905 domain-containing protein n=1 Tax=Litorihabitans aurantiacus TaxID=1930061 RepID=A0AA37UWP1_9MICO|nr:DUF1905 domain-containing protein [Litorihabitans aurantiacus]GMA30562.1 hypothetical protein GCM10025875_05540 [Litorihabitans aurantiacus]